MTSPVFSPGFFWIVNDRFDPDAFAEELATMVANGCRSACLHPIPQHWAPVSFPSKMDPDYLTDGYFEAYGRLVDHAARMGVNFWLYDEGGWPSGSACGQVVASDPERFARRTLSIGEDGRPVVNVSHGDPAKRALYPSLIEPGATQRFIELTHERVKAVAGRHFGKTIQFAFMDEPVFPISWPGKSLGWCTDFAEQFKARKGYDIMPFVADLIAVDAPYADGLKEPLFKNRKETVVPDRIAKVRIDYMDVRADLFVERFLVPIRDWCRANGLKSGGHFGGEDQPEGNAYFGYGHVLRALRALDCPGVDAIWRQIWPRGGENMPFPRYAASAAHQSGGRHVMSESFAVYGAGMTPEEMRWVAGYLLARGITMFVFSSYPQSTVPVSKEPLVPRFGPPNPFWDFQKPFFDTLSADCERLSRGRSAATAAILFDIRGIWAGGADMADAVDRHVEASRALDAAHVDHDFVDDDQVAAAPIVAGRLVVGEMAYETIVVPTDKWVLPAAKEKLAAFERAGGRVVRGTDVAGVPPSWGVSGEGAEDIRVLRRRDGDRDLLLFFNEGLVAREIELDAIGPARLDSGEWLIWETGDPPPCAGDASCGSRLRATALDGWEPPLGDWRERLGEHFSGKETYRCVFRHDGGKAVLDLGRVCWCCRATLNGEELPAKFWGPFRWEVELRPGENVLEVTVANTMANVLTAKEDSSPYKRYLDRFNSEHQESGLFGPVTVASC